MDGEEPDKSQDKTHISRTSRHCFPNKRFILETGKEELSTACSISSAHRQRLARADRRAAAPAKTVLMQKLANAILKNNPETYLFILLIDERPEEVTDMDAPVSVRK